MAGKMCTGVKTNNAALPSQSRAYCEGMAYRATGTLITAPKVTNPHPAGSEDAVAWDLGWDYAEAGKSATVPLDTSGTCCAPVGLVLL
jgi:hypothetical protein